ncbi:hypothetical protein HMPREF7215_0307 [Pyramidobacter piscolens W5455]|uniref:Uncharacterized protein n=1 Tax=Pyramidobacter piscolens W5455 TaxID=352165 RepID=A0ABM9ZWA5_9BACT|nr:hypothetical protein HMPREF7215_0307 [Pyramidobacter piscolens W5455]
MSPQGHLSFQRSLTKKKEFPGIFRGTPFFCLCVSFEA